jgi:hypothetical protein
MITKIYLEYCIKIRRKKKEKLATFPPKPAWRVGKPLGWLVRVPCAQPARLVAGPAEPVAGCCRTPVGLPCAPCCSWRPDLLVLAVLRSCRLVLVAASCCCTLSWMLWPIGLAEGSSSCLPCYCRSGAAASLLCLGQASLWCCCSFAAVRLA